MPFYCALHEHHTFPTRRSSDLRIDLSDAIENRLDLRGLHDVRILAGDALEVAGKGRVFADCLEAVAQRLDRLRSEEHTSELQSQSNLVCRLLLEKKKKRKYHTM